MRHGFLANEINGVHFLSVPSFDETGLCVTCFSTRLGGVSKAPLNSMNLGFGRGDEKSNVLKNYELLGKAAGFDASRTVAFSQVHKNDVCIVSGKDAGEAFLPQKREFDAVITNTPGLPIATYHADCVPIYLLDPVKRVCAVAHAGWRGTALRSPASAIRAMCENFASVPSDILSAIGPSIAECCFETHAEVPDSMLSAFGEEAKKFISDIGGGKFRVSLQDLNILTLLECGIPDDNITVSDECTCCRSDMYWSHRKTGGVRGTMGAFIMLREVDERQ